MKVKDGIIGLIVGDALGVPVEFQSRTILHENPVTGMRGYGTYNKPQGTWSDDSAMALATMHSIVQRHGIDYDDMMGKFVKWLYDAKYMQGNDTFDYGITTSTAINRYVNLKPALESGCSGDRDNGNGSLMRILPLAYIKDIDYDTIENVSALTHAHKRSKIACVLYVEMAKSMLENKDLSIDEHVKNACDKIRNYYEGDNELEKFNRIFNDELDDVDTIESGGYVIHSLESTIHCLKNTDNYKDAVLKAVNLGKDTDTTAAICGGLAGIYYGFDEIPVHWIDTVEQIDKVFALCEKFEEYCDESQ